MRICFLSSVPITLWAFYRGLIGRLTKSCDEVAVVSSPLRQLEYFKDQLKVTTFAIDFFRKITPFRDLISLFKLWRVLRSKNFDIIHAHTPKGSLLAMLASFLLGVPNRIYTMHGTLLDTAHGPQYPLLWLVEWLTSRLSTNILTVTPTLRQWMIERKFCPANKIRVLAHGSACGVDLKLFSPSKDLVLAGRKVRADYGIDDDAVVIGYVGRMVPDKGTKELVEAFERLQKQLPDCYLLLVGEFEQLRETIDSQTMDSIRYNDHIVYNGQWVDDVRPFYAAMDISVLPTRREAFGLTMIESAALELPTIGTKSTGCVHSIADGTTGLLVDVDNPQQLHQAMLRLARDSQLREKLGAQGRRRVEEQFDAELVINAHIDFYKSLFPND